MYGREHGIIIVSLFYEFVLCRNYNINHLLNRHNIKDDWSNENDDLDGWNNDENDNNYKKLIQIIKIMVVIIIERY